MTTANSPRSALKAQADRMAFQLKRNVTPTRGGNCKFAVVMDDKTIIIEMAWSKIRDTPEADLSEMIVANMQVKK